MMSDFIGDDKCVTHHDACECREAKFKQIEAELAETRGKIEQLNDLLDRARQECMADSNKWKIKYETERARLDKVLSAFEVTTSIHTPEAGWQYWAGMKTAWLKIANDKPTLDDYRAAIDEALKGGE